MGEEEKKPKGEQMEEKKVEDAHKPAEAKREEPKSDNPAAVEKKNPDESKDSTQPPPPPQEIVLKVYMHCEGCAKKVRRCLKGFEGVDGVFTDCKSHKVVVKGEKADPLKVFERIQKKSHRKVELLSPIPAPPPPPTVEEPTKAEEKEAPKTEEKKTEVITVVLKVYMHCEACSQEIKRRILRMKGVENVEADLGNSQVSVKGIFDPEKLLHYVLRKTGKQAVIVKPAEPSEKKDEEKDKEGEKKAEGGGGEGGDDVAKEKKDGVQEAPADGGDAMKVLETKKNEFYYYNPQIHQINPQIPNEGLIYQNYPSQMFSDENPNACSLM